jgi:prepilin-type N-terminal cleavage/methylation domain-containing protein
LQPACRSAQTGGFSLTEILIVVSIIAILAVVAVPLLTGQDTKKLDAAAVAVGSALRLAINEATRTGAYILVDAKTTAGYLKVRKSDATATDLGAVTDPVTKQSLDINTAGAYASTGVSMTVKFMQSGTPYTQLLISPTTQLQVFDGATVNKGVLQTGSGVVLDLGTQSVTVAIDESTGFVTIP